MRRETKSRPKASGRENEPMANEPKPNCKKCPNPLPEDNGITSQAARAQDLCRYCYLGEFPHNSNSRYILGKYRINHEELQYYMMHKEEAVKRFGKRFFTGWLEEADDAGKARVRKC
ncbi:MAG: hypothetical protein HY811_08775 [Planctomycetes bacterium]|nr:hypothetical protein [Planctomycetota bacterium]